MPDSAKKVFSGEIFDVYQWEQKLFDGSTATFERLRRRDSVQIIAQYHDKWVILHEEQPAREPFSGLPGGVVEYGEDSLLAAKRELLEETGLVSENWELLFSVDPAPNKIEWTARYYVARDCRKTAEQTLDPGEKIVVDTVDFDEFVRVALSDVFRSKGLTYTLLRAKHDGTLDEFRKRLLGVDA